MNVTYLDDSGTPTTREAVPTLPRQVLDDPQRFLRSVAYVSLTDLISFMRQQHPEGDVSLIQVSSDGVECSKNGEKKLHMVSVAVEGCRSPYPWRIWEYK